MRFSFIIRYPAFGHEQRFCALPAGAGKVYRPLTRSLDWLPSTWKRFSEFMQALTDCRVCFGALVAYKMAQQLLAHGKQVSFLGLFINYAPEQNFVDGVQTRIDRHLDQLRQMGPKAKLQLSTSNLATKVQSLLWRTAYQMFGHRLPRSSRLFQNIPELNLQAAKKYCPKPYSGKMTVFLSGPVPSGFELDPHSHLDGMHAADIHLRLVPGDRDSMFQEPHVSVLAAELKQCLRAS